MWPCINRPHNSTFEVKLIIASKSPFLILEQSDIKHCKLLQYIHNKTQ